MSIYFVMAVLLILAGHICKISRWKYLISIYEETKTKNLIRAMVLGQVINLFVSWRIGDLIRIYYSGKKLKNGYALSIATVIADLYMDTLTVGLAFLSLYMLGIHKDEVAGIAKVYVLLSAIVIVTTIFVFKIKKYIKKIVWKLAAVFNAKIELAILYTTYALFASLKNIFNKINFKRIITLTILMWGNYFISYEMFAKYMRSRGNEFTFTKVFKILFSFAGNSLYKESIFYLEYLLIPLGILACCTIFVRYKSDDKIYGYRLLPQLNLNEKLAFLETYFEDGEKKDYLNLYLNINRDIGIIQDCSAGSNATTILCLDGDRTFFRKYAFAEDAVRLSKQAVWIKRYKDMVPVASIIREMSGDNFYYYDMEYRPEAINFFQYIHTMPIEKSWHILRSVLTCLRNNIYIQRKPGGGRETVEKYISAKVNDSMEVCLNRGGRWLKDLCCYDVLCINGVNYPNLNYYKNLVDKVKLIERFSNEKYSVIHGDLTIENIICLQNSAEEWYLIDPNTENLHESAFLDYAKLLQSLHGGYEFLMMVEDVSIEGNKVNFLYTRSSSYSSLYKKYKDYLNENFTKEDIINIYLHEAIHWLRLMPYKIRKDSRKAVVFYAGMLMVLHDIEQMF